MPTKISQMTSQATPLAADAVPIVQAGANYRATIGSFFTAALAFLQGGTGATARTAQAKMRDFVSAKDFGAVGDGTTNDSAAIQAALNYYAIASGRGVVFLPAGKYRIESTLIIPEHVFLVGDTSDRLQTGTPGSELAWYGADASTAVTCSTGDTADWGKGAIKNIRIQNYTMTSSGYGLRVRNPTNNSFLDNVHVAGFPTRQIYVYEASPPVTPSTPSAFSMRNIFASGGVIPVEIMRGVEAISVSDMICGTDSTTTQGVLISENVNDATGVSAQRCSITFNSCIVEIDPSSANACVGFDWVTNISIVFVGCCVQRNSGTGTEAAFRYTNATYTWPTAEFVNCTSWRMAACFEAVSAGFEVANPSGGATVAKSFSWHRTSQESAFVYVRSDVLAAQAGAGVPFANLVGIVESAGILMPRPGVVSGISARVNAAITGGSLTAKVIKNGVTLMKSSVLNAANQQRYSHVEVDYDGAVGLLFDAGDRIGVFYDSEAGFLPTGSLDLTVCLFIQFRS